MKFSIVTPTYHRSHLVTRAINSLLQQTYTDWEMIIVNDSPEDQSYDSIAVRSKTDNRIKYLRNIENRGVNYSRNRALDQIATDSNFVIFLDDDDYLAPNALQSLWAVIEACPTEQWIVTNRCSTDGLSFTSAPVNDASYSYARDYLLLRRVKGDATHCISTKILRDVHFSAHIRQAEEWLFFFTLGQRSHFFYSNINTTISEGYVTTGLNYRSRTVRSELKTLICLCKEGWQRGLFNSPYFPAYLVARVLRIFASFR